MLLLILLYHVIHSQQSTYIVKLTKWPSLQTWACLGLLIYLNDNLLELILKLSRELMLDLDGLGSTIGVANFGVDVMKQLVPGISSLIWNVCEFKSYLLLERMSQ